MLALRAFFALAAAAVAVANPLNTRQSTNTNAAINEIVSGLDETMHVVMPNLLFLQANETIDNANVAVQVNTLITAFNNVTSALAATPVSSGSTTVLPTNDDISILFADCTSLLASAFSSTMTDSVKSFTSNLSTLDAAVANSLNQFNITLPGSVKLVHTMMLDAQQFLVKDDVFPQTVAALGF
ncbi:hypothetical protein E4T56_gene17960 [Termitomyces sp. T112]|nr:hypothetical protein E4T56_gene17960 [Termitomyces sp. T112]KAH0585467.1 hypothetical protein H2248_008707 [Termitomyces sp. 'cryptogamus']